MKELDLNYVYRVFDKNVEAYRDSEGNNALMVAVMKHKLPYVL